MTGKTTILMRQLGVKSEKVKTGLFRSDVRIVLDGECGGDEVLCAFHNDGENARILTVGKDGIFAEGQSPKEGDMLFAVRRTPFDFNKTIDAGIDPENNKWEFKVDGKVEILKPEIFARAFRGDVTKGEPLFLEAFCTRLGTIPSTTIHREVILKVLGVKSLQDQYKDEEKKRYGGRYADVQHRFVQAKEIGEDYISNALNKAFNNKFFAAEGVVSIKVTDFLVDSPDRTAKLHADIEHDNYIRNQAIENAHNEAKREEQRKQKKHELEMAKDEAQIAEYEAQKKKLQGGDTASAFAAFEIISNVLEDAVAKSGTGSFADMVKDARRAESGLRLLALARDKKRMGGVTLAKNNPSFSTRTICGGSYQERGFVPITAKTPVLHHMETLSSTISSECREGYLTILNVSEKNEIVPLLPNGDFPENLRISRGERMLVADKSCPMLTALYESATSGTDHLVALITDKPLLNRPLPALGASLSPTEANELVVKLMDMDASEWAADINSYTILP